MNVAIEHLQRQINSLNELDKTNQERLAKLEATTNEIRATIAADREQSRQLNLAIERLRSTQPLPVAPVVPTTQPEHQKRNKR